MLTNVCGIATLVRSIAFLSYWGFYFNMQEVRKDLKRRAHAVHWEKYRKAVEEKAETVEQYQRLLTRLCWVWGSSLGIVALSQVGQLLGMQ